MGIASRTKWEYRAQRPLAQVTHLDPAKLAHAARLLSGKRRAAPMFAARRQRLADAAASAEAKHAKHILLRRKAAKRRGWVPYAVR
jgi:hypothetical protein